MNNHGTRVNLVLHTFGQVIPGSKNLVVVLVVDHVVFHTNVHFQQLETSSKGSQSSTSLAVCTLLI